MLFNSLQFLVFFPIVTAVYFLLPHRFRWIFLLIASIYFYISFIPAYLAVMAVLIFVDYFVGRALQNYRGRRRYLLLLLSIFANVGMLFVFKYFNFFNANITSLAHALDWNYSLGALALALPLGLSFHTFQSLSYIFEVYRGRQIAEKHFGIYALYVMFFPQLVAGPIERPQHLLPQFKRNHYFAPHRVTEGLRIMVFGFFKKIVIADNIALIVNPVFNNPHAFSGPVLIIAAFAFAIQLYTDFSGYSDIAVGTARVLGFDLIQNFNRPYFSKSVSEFWRRWHISLSSWLRDYIYIPLGGSRVSNVRWAANIMATFLLSGLWHGAGWTFVIMGSLFGMYIVVGQVTRSVREKFIHLIRLDRAPRFLGTFQVLITGCLVTFAWIFFRANSLGDGLYIATHLFSGLTNPHFETLFTSLDKFRLAGLACAVTALCVYEYMERRQTMPKIIAAKPAWIRWTLYYVFVMSIILFGYFKEQPFIYFQF